MSPTTGRRMLLLLLLALSVCLLESANVEYDASGIFVPASKGLTAAGANTTQTQEKHFRLKREIAEEVKGTSMVLQSHSTTLASQLITNKTLVQITKTTENVDAPTAMPQNASATADVPHVVTNHTHGFTTHHTFNATGGSTVNISIQHKCVHSNKTDNFTAYNTNGTLDYSHNASNHHGSGSHNDTKTDPEHGHAPHDHAAEEDLPQSEGLWPLLILAMPVVVIGTSLLYARFTQWVRDSMARHRRRPFARLIERITKRDPDPPSDPRGNLLQLKEFDVDDECSL